MPGLAGCSKLRILHVPSQRQKKCVFNMHTCLLCGQVVYDAYLRLRILKTCSGPSFRYKMPHELNLQLRLCQHTNSTSKSAIAMHSMLLTCQARLTSGLGSSLHPACQTVQTMLLHALLHSVATETAWLGRIKGSCF
jgi:hypothetical protein